ncbi:MFS general substrate transporter [Lepidopterella palustris CBS 459.81]|uniref:MFS general substrate transporter n=1 Tax=Lepidopterella palustris CBS 459.81 TaxID=1314670 RepID=A0A8E2EIY3_9PEZI|nr:MFS general substrate transporter [Lepidopterella palustris CBS 459.81]
MPSRPQWLLSLTQHGSEPPFLLKYRSSGKFIIFTVSLAVFTDMFLYGILVPVFPFVLQAKSHIAADKVQYWVSVLIAVYGAALLAFSPVFGWIADQTSSRRSPLLLGLLALLGTTVMLNIGSRIGILVVARVLQGTSAAVVWIVGLALIADTVPQSEIGQAMGFVGLGMSLGILVAPLLGGVVFQRAGYNAVFAMAYALVGLDICLRLALVEKKVAVRWGPNVLDDQAANGGAVSPNQSEREGNDSMPLSNGELEELATGPGLDNEKHIDRDIEKETEIYSGKEMEMDTEKEATTSSPSHSSGPASKRLGTLPLTKLQSPNQSPPTPSTSFAKRPLRRRLPPLLSLLYSRRLLAALWGSLVQASLITAFDSVLAIEAHALFGWYSTNSALLFLPVVIPSFFAPLVGMAIDRWGPRYPATAGFLFACIPYICLRFVNSNTLGAKILLCALLFAIGTSLTLTFPPFMAEISGVVEAKERSMLAQGGKGWGEGGAYAQAYGLFNMAFAGGCLVGPVWAGFVRESKGWGTMGWTLGLLSAVTAVPTFLWMGGWVGDVGLRVRKKGRGMDEDSGA